MEVTYFQEPGKNFKEPFLLYFIAHFCAGCQITLTFAASIKLA